MVAIGKSTLLDKLSKAGYFVIPEPVDQIWGKYLPKLYEDLERWNTMRKKINKLIFFRTFAIFRNNSYLKSPKTMGFCFQMEVLDWFRQLHWNNLKAVGTPSKNQKKKDEKTQRGRNKEGGDGEELSADKANEHGDIIIVERSALTAFEIFSKNLKENGRMSEWEFSLLTRFFQLVDWEPKYTLYLQCDPGTCIGRIHQRNRDGEDKVDEELIRSLHERHEKLFVKHQESGEKMSPSKDTSVLRCISNINSEPKKQSSGNSHVLVVNGNNDKDRVFQDTVKQLDYVRNLLAQ
ncbi:deoxypurine kinase [Reticulomyxa filosa]|uniref:Deoxypurine kinase n=1 Tax=Reticulomyxa filosa TaxID=46433 RepID=X6NMK2_RETFI|nr:deoxypurine kinase [Reticulomyxa filosa]|eukprot:ETO26904.1 deoxypurine kinase [Reticulomyxa filosa]